MKIGEYLTQVGVPDKYLSASLDADICFTGAVATHVSKRYFEIYDSARRIVKDKKVGVILEGASGSGKTYLGCAMLRGYLKGGDSVCRTTSTEIADFYFEGFQGIRDRYLIAKVLFIDDACKDIKFVKQNNSQILEKVIKKRSDAGLLTLYACSSLAELKSRFSEDIYKVIIGSSIRFEFPVIDWRQAELQDYAKRLKEKV